MSDVIKNCYSSLGINNEKDRKNILEQVICVDDNNIYDFSYSIDNETTPLE